MSKPKENLFKKEIVIFRTSVDSKDKVRTLKPLLNRLIGSKNWDFNLNNHENILKINYFPKMKNFLAREISKMGFECKEIYEEDST